MQLHQHTINAAIIDLDGTMVDTLGDFVAALNLMLQDLPRGGAITQLDASVVGCMVGKGSEHLIRSVLRHVRQHQPELTDAVLDPAVYELAWASYQKHYAAINGRFSDVYPGVVEGLQALKDGGVKLACLTNKPTAFAQQLLRLKRLDTFFGVVFGGDAFEHKKPHPLPLLKTCESLGSAVSRTLMVGDSSNDAKAARAAGCPVVLVTYGYNHGEPVRGVDADGYVDSLAQLGVKLSRA